MAALLSVIKFQSLVEYFSIYNSVKDCLPKVSLTPDRLLSVQIRTLTWQPSLVALPAYHLEEQLMLEDAPGMDP